mmetsp:Transcript_28832/g.92852  ORF Transcript_28832/g.92852 Transcript_28832/m.92852 type:complete len:225 (+) Transcript_28832:292-966(+)
MANPSFGAGAGGSNSSSETVARLLDILRRSSLVSSSSAGLRRRAGGRRVSGRSGGSSNMGGKKTKPMDSRSLTRYLKCFRRTGSWARSMLTRWPRGSPRMGRGHGSSSGMTKSHCTAKVPLIFEKEKRHVKKKFHWTSLMKTSRSPQSKPMASSSALRWGSSQPARSPTRRPAVTCPSFRPSNRVGHGSTCKGLRNRLRRRSPTDSSSFFSKRKSSAPSMFRTW